MGLAALAQNGATAPANSINPADIVGTWELNLRNSNWGNLPPPKSATINVLSYDGREMQWTAEAADEHGNNIAASWKGALDATLVEATGTNGGVYYSFQPSEEGIRETTTFPEGSRITSLATISPDGRTLTLRRHMTSPTRGEADWIEVYEKTAGR
ncbi:MAG: hypothetical protein ABSD88_18830 [Candidatus Korobacteraceae bacterium]|jgi:hypothetical protein